MNTNSGPRPADHVPADPAAASAVPRAVDVAVVGAGLAGLTAARIAGAGGCTVAVFEAGAIGGRARSHDRSGFRFNLGPRALYLAGPGRAVLDRLQIVRTGGAPWLSKTALLLDGDLVTAPTSPRSFLTSPSLSVRGKAQLGMFMGILGRVRPADLAAVSTDSWLDGKDLRPEVSVVLRGLLRLGTYCNDLDLLSADAGVAALQASAKGVLYADGGWQTIVDQLADGLDIHRLRVAGVHGDDEGADLTLDSGETVRARTVVVAVNSPEAAEAILGVRLAAHGPPSRARCLTLGTSTAARTPVVVGVSQPLYLSMHCPPAKLFVDGRSGGAVVHVMRYVDRHEAEQAADPAAAKAELLQLAARCGLTADTIVESEYLHLMTVASSIPTAGTGGMAGRIAIDGSGIGSVVLAGDFVGSSGLLADCSLVSAEAAALVAADRSRVNGRGRVVNGGIGVNPS